MDCVLTVSGIQKRRAEELFSPVSFTLVPSQGLGVFGHNGCGKTTLLDIIAGLERPSAGRVQAPTQIGYVMQQPGFQDSLSFRDNLLAEAHLAGLRGRAAREQVEQVATRLEITPYWKKRYATGSAGMKGRLGLAAALLGAPPLLLLDEAFNYLDEQTVAVARRVLAEEKQRGVALVMVSHDRLDFVGLCEQVLLLPQANFAVL
ncbi:MAG: ATP-binding cassette domain-containing protein [Coriobacteriales bacterium]|nr:ATP-binding cassette domain-containing protein [Coriobacteriales bacterium]